MKRPQSQAQASPCAADATRHGIDPDARYRRQWRVSFPYDEQRGFADYIGSGGGLESLTLGLIGINIHDLRRTASERMRRLGHRHVVGLVLGHAPRGVTDIHYDTDDLWAYETEKRAALEAWFENISKTAAIDDRQFCLDLLRPAA
jgi:integrase